MAPIPPQSPPRIIPAEEIVPTMKSVIVNITSVIDDIVAEVSPETACFSNTVEPYIAVNNSYQGEIGVIFMLQYAAPAAETQSIVSDAIRLWSEAQSSLIARQDYLLLLQAVKERNESLDTESQLLLDDLLLDCQERGLSQMSPEQVQQHLRNSEEIEQLAMEFRQNMAHDSNGVWLTEQELDGVPSDETSRWPTETDGPNIGRKFVPFSNGGTIAVLTHAKSADVRERMFLADHRNLEPNDRLLQAIIMKRQTQAAGLGYESHAAFRAQRRLLKSTKVIRDFLDSLKQDLVALGKVEVDLLRRHQDPCSSATATEGRTNAFPAWDQVYCSKRAEKERDIDHGHISEYFPLDHTAEAMLTVFESLLGLQFLEMSQSDLGSQYFWHHTVRAFSVWEQGQEEFVGYLFFDLLWRENKYRGNQNVTHECASLRLILLLSDVVTLFHGHGIHNLLSKTKYARFHGTNLPPDFGEMPSMLLENLCWRQDVLEQLSCHYTHLDSRYATDWRQRNIGADVLPDCKIPSHLVDALARNSYVTTIELVKSQDEAESLDLGDKFYSLREECESLDFGDLKRTGHWHGSIPHFVGGYDVGYYSYLVCTAFAQDIYESVFQDDPWDRSKWRKLRREVLEYGGSHPNMMGMLRDFLGRPPSREVFIETLKRAIEEDSARESPCK
ncbi:peptidase M3A M3B [Fusarium sp. NRRL 52700]|nr:peptidase M3A M3B [Fusarium sp. NRRL 52700]